MQSIRHLTVSHTSRRSSIRTQMRDALGNVVCESVKPIYSTCPTLKLSGAWLAEAGFHEGCSVRVEVSKGQLIVTLDLKQVNKD